MNHFTTQGPTRRFQAKVAIRASTGRIRANVKATKRKWLQGNQARADVEEN